MGGGRPWAPAGLIMPSSGRGVLVLARALPAGPRASRDSAWRRPTVERDRVGLPEAQVLAGDRDAEALAQRGDVGPVGRAELVAGVESHQPLRRDAVHSAALHRALPGQRLGGIVLPVLRRPVETACVLVKHDDVEVDLAPGIVAQDEVPGAGVGTGHGCIPATLQGGYGHRHIAFLDADVQVAVTPRHGAEAGAPRPA